MISNQTISSYRKPVYDFVQKLAGRHLTPAEHEELKGFLVAYAEAQAGKVQELKEIVGRQSGRLKGLGRTVWNLTRKKGIPEEEISFLKPLFEEPAATDSK